MKYLFIAIFTISAFSSFSQKNIEFRSLLPYNKELSDVWGYEANGREYALVGANNGMLIVDVTNPDEPEALFLVPGVSSIWRDMHVWGTHAYISNESGGGISIVDLSYLPDSLGNITTWTADTLLKTAHNIWIDENGYFYAFGYNSMNGTVPYDNRGVLIADLNNDPENPEFVNVYSDNYVHDGFVRGDTMWLAEISAGYLTAIDISDKNNLQTLGSAESPGKFCHNVWLTDDGKTIFTTDEIEGGYIGSFDVSDLNNINEYTRYRASEETRPIPHNVHVKGNYLWTSYYTYGLSLIDATRPDNLVEVGRYSTSSFPTYGTFNGNWGTYPYLSSGNILASDIEEGLYVLTPTYTRACYLEGNIIDSLNSLALQNVNVEIIGEGVKGRTDIIGDYKIGIVDSGYYDIRISYQGCPSKIITGVHLQKGQVKQLDISFNCEQAFTNIASADNGNKFDLTVLANSILYYSGLHSEKGYIQIIDLSGKVLKAFDLNTANGEIQIGDDFAKGYYLAVLNSGNQKIVRKFQKF